MTNIRFGLINEETINQITNAEPTRVDAFANLAETQKSMRGLIAWPLLPKLVAALERLMSMSGPNSIANLERATRSRSVK